MDFDKIMKEQAESSEKSASFGEKIANSIQLLVQVQRRVSIQRNEFDSSYTGSESDLY